MGALSAAGEMQCVICLGQFSEDESLRRLGCGHVYHAECLDPWLQRNAICPRCRRCANMETHKSGFTSRVGLLLFSRMRRGLELARNGFVSFRASMPASLSSGSVGALPRFGTSSQSSTVLDLESEEESMLPTSYDYHHHHHHHHHPHGQHHHHHRHPRAPPGLPNFYPYNDSDAGSPGRGGGGGGGAGGSSGGGGGAGAASSATNSPLYLTPTPGTTMSPTPTTMVSSSWVTSREGTGE